MLIEKARCDPVTYWHSHRAVATPSLVCEDRLCIRGYIEIYQETQQASTVASDRTVRKNLRATGKEKKILFKIGT